MTKLAAIRSQLASLGFQRQAIRWGTAFAGFLSASIWILLGVFVVDWIFQRSLDTTQRLILDVLAALALFWAYHKFAAPFLGVKEDETELALLVERQQGISSDLVAAMQFESPAADTWGSRQLANAVIDQMAEKGKRLNVFEGLDRKSFHWRIFLLLLSVGLVVLPALVYSQYSSAFFARLFLRSRHYPSATQITSVLLNGAEVLSSSDLSSAPATAKSPELLPVEVAVLCEGELPPAGGIASMLGLESRQRRALELKPLSTDERKARLKNAGERIAHGIAEGAVSLFEPWRKAAIALSADAPEVVAKLQKTESAAELAECQSLLDKAAASLTENDGASALYIGRIDRLTESHGYKLFVGDAWTDSSEIRKIPLPLLTAHVKATPPEYARYAKQSKIEESDRYVATLEGSSIQLELDCLNKPLREAWLVLTSERKLGAEGAAPAPARLNLKKTDGEGKTWSLAGEGTPLAEVRQNLAYEIQVVDSDGLSLVEPLAGRIVVKDDRGPGIHCSAPERIWLSSAMPKINFTVRDDYGIAGLRLHVKVEHANGRNSSETRDLPLPSVAQTDSAKKKFLSSDQLPYSGQVTIPLAGLKLKEADAAANSSLPAIVKDDRVEVVLEAIDYRGSAAGKASLSSPLYLPIGQQSDVLTAVDRSLDSADQKATITIDTQIGIGESP